MAENPKILYEIDLSALPPERHAFPDAACRPLAVADRDALAHLMLDAYTGTIDHDGGTIDDALDEVDGWLESTTMLDHSFGAVVDDQLVSAVLLQEVDDLAFISYVMTGATHKRSHWARTVVDASLASLRSSGRKRAIFYITEGNTASERLFGGVGAYRL